MFLLADICENIRNKYIETCTLELAHFLSAPELAWQASFKKTEIELELLTNIDMLQMVLDEESIMKFINMQTQIVNILKTIIKTKNH